MHHASIQDLEKRPSMSLAVICGSILALISQLALLHCFSRRLSSPLALFCVGTSPLVQLEQVCLCQTSCMVVQPFFPLVRVTYIGGEAFPCFHQLGTVALQLLHTVLFCFLSFVRILQKPRGLIHVALV